MDDNSMKSNLPSKGPLVVAGGGFGWITSRLFVAACFLAALTIALSHARPQNPYLGVADQLVQVGALTVWLVWLTRRSDEANARRASLGIVGISIVIAYCIYGDLWSLLIDFGVTIPCLRHLFTQDCRTRLVSVRAPGLFGMVEYQSMHFSGVLVEECSSDWRRPLGQTETDANGHFDLSSASEGGIRHLRVSWPGTRTVCLNVEMSSTAEPLLIRLKPQQPRRKLNWGD
jgi:hypothetical protein